jgi:hypothetical protein
MNSGIRSCLTHHVGHVERRCACGLFLAIVHGEELHIKYKDFTGIVRGQLRIRCRRCGRVAEVTTELRSAA